MLALSPHDSVNLAAVLHYRMELGKNNVYILQSKPDNGSKKSQNGSLRRGKRLFGAEVTYETMESALAAGATVKITDLTDAFGMAELLETHGEEMIPLFAIDEHEHIHVFSAEQEVEPEADWSVISLVPETAVSQDKPSAA